MDDTRTHLIERAAARLRSAPAAAARPAAFNHAAAAGSLAPGARVAAEHEAISNPILRPVPRPCISADALAKAGLISSDRRNDRTAEEFRIVQEKILRHAFGLNGATSGRSNGATAGRPNLVMITSARKGDGKSFCAINLAGEIARQGGRKVLLVDIDPKPGGLADLAGVAAEVGLRDLAHNNQFDVANIAIATETDNLEFLPFGTSSNGNDELFASRRTAEVIEALGERYSDRLIIFDTPPCLASSTPHTLAAVVGQVVLVAASGSTREIDIEACLDLLQACPNVSLLLNKVPAWMTHPFGSYPNAVAGD